MADDVRPFLGSRLASFADSKIADSITRTLATLEADKHVAVVAYADTKGEGRLAAFARIDDDWSLMGVLSHAPGETWGGEVAVRWSK